jgi:hypothetical protein
MSWRVEPRPRRILEVPAGRVGTVAANAAARHLECLPPSRVRRQLGTMLLWEQS